MKKTSTPETLVIFKKCEGEVVAVFPELAGTSDPYTMTCYAHVGQHAHCNTAFVANSKPAKPEEYESLLKELTQVGYEKIRVVRKHLDKYTKVRELELATLHAEFMSWDKGATP